MNAAYVTTADPSDVRRWAGTLYYVARALEAQSISLDRIGPLAKKYAVPLKAKEAVYQNLLRKRYLRDREPIVAKHYARQIERSLSREHELVFGVGTIPISYLDCSQPIVVWTDATFAALVDFYPEFTNLSAGTLRNGHAMEAAALSRSRLIIYSSEWAAESATSHYGIDRSKLAIVPFGPNIDIEMTAADADAAVAARPTGICRLLFVGADWERKGGPLAIDIAAALNAAGLETELNLVGRYPGKPSLPSFVIRHGFLDKTCADGRKALHHLFLSSHFLVFPTRADCSPVVLSEASAHAVPSLATRVGGIPTAVHEDVNGKLFDSRAGAEEYCAYVLEVLTTPGRYRELALSSFEEYRRRLNWELSGATVRRLLEDVIGNHG
jgi:glycosyltransferase involved in cell wall biosynthesis